MINKFDLKYKLKPISDILFFFGNKLKPPITKVYEEPYSTHIPVIIGISSLINVKNILELGSGIYSTGTFLNEKIFPNIQKLESYEDDAQWAQKIKSRYGNDKRLQLNLVNSPIHSFINSIDLPIFDLTLIDDSQRVSDRVLTIREFCRQSKGNTVLILHDFEIEEYRKAAKRLKHHFTFSSFTPCTGVLWNQGLNKADLFQISQLINRHKANLKTTDIDGWLKVFNIAK